MMAVERHQPSQRGTFDFSHHSTVHANHPRQTYHHAAPYQTAQAYERRQECFRPSHPQKYNTQASLSGISHTRRPSPVEAQIQERHWASNPPKIPHLPSIAPSFPPSPPCHIEDVRYYNYPPPAQQQHGLPLPLASPSTLSQEASGYYRYHQPHQQTVYTPSPASPTTVQHPQQPQQQQQHHQSQLPQPQQKQHTQSPKAEPNFYPSPTWSPASTNSTLVALPQPTNPRQLPQHSQPQVQVQPPKKRQRRTASPSTATAYPTFATAPATAASHTPHPLQQQQQPQKSPSPPQQQKPKRKADTPTTSSTSAKTTLTSLPTPVITNIVSHLPESSQTPLSLTCRTLFTTVRPRSPREKLAAVLQVEQNTRHDSPVLGCYACGWMRGHECFAGRPPLAVRVGFFPTAGKQDVTPKEEEGEVAEEEDGGWDRYPLVPGWAWGGSEEERERQRVAGESGKKEPREVEEEGEWRILETKLYATTEGPQGPFASKDVSPAEIAAAVGKPGEDYWVPRLSPEKEWRRVDAHLLRHGDPFASSEGQGDENEAGGLEYNSTCNGTSDYGNNHRHGRAGEAGEEGKGMDTDMDPPHQFTFPHGAPPTRTLVLPLRRFCMDCGARDGLHGVGESMLLFGMVWKKARGADPIVSMASMTGAEKDNSRWVCGCREVRRFDPLVCPDCDRTCPFRSTGAGGTYYLRR